MRNKKIKELTTYAMVIALIVMISYLPIGYITIGIVSFTTQHILVIIAGFVLGIKGGLVAGLSFGITSMIKAFAAPATSFDYVFANPLVSILPRLIFGFLAGLAGKLLATNYIKNNSKEKYLLFSTLSAIILTLLHTLLVVSAVYLFGRFNMGMNIIKFLIEIILLIAIAEMVFAGTICPMVSYALKNYGILKRGTANEKNEK